MTQNTQVDEMRLQGDGLMIIGYNSVQLGPLFWTPDEWYTPLLACVNSIVDTETGPAVITSVHGGIELRPLWVNQEAAARVEMRALAMAVQS